MNRMDGKRIRKKILAYGPKSERRISVGQESSGRINFGTGTGWGICPSIHLTAVPITLYISFSPIESCKNLT